MSNEEIFAEVSAQLEEIHLGLSGLMTTMDCLADSRSLELADNSEPAMVFPTLTFVGRYYLDQLETLMLLVDKSKPAA